MQSSQDQDVGLRLMPTTLGASNDTPRDIPLWMRDATKFLLDWFSINRTQLVRRTKEYTSELRRWRKCPVATANRLKGGLKRIMMFLYSHMSYIDNKNLIECDIEEELIMLVSMYVDMELKVWLKKREELVASGTDAAVVSKWERRIANRLSHWLYTCLTGHTQRVDALLSLHTVCSRHSRPVLDPVFRKVLSEMESGPLADVSYVRHMLVYKVWRERVLAGEDESSRTLNEVVVSHLVPVNSYGRFSAPLRACLGKVPRNADNVARYHLMPNNINLRKACNDFLRCCRVPSDDINFGSISLIDDDFDEFSDSEEDEVKKLLKMISEGEEKRSNSKERKESDEPGIPIVDLTDEPADGESVIDLTEDDEEQSACAAAATQSLSYRAQQPQQQPMKARPSRGAAAPTPSDYVSLRTAGEEDVYMTPNHVNFIIMCPLRYGEGFRPMKLDEKLRQICMESATRASSRHMKSQDEFVHVAKSEQLELPKDDEDAVQFEPAARQEPPVQLQPPAEPVKWEAASCVPPATTADEDIEFCENLFSGSLTVCDSVRQRPHRTCPPSANANNFVSRATYDDARPTTYHLDKRKTTTPAPDPHDDRLRPVDFAKLSRAHTRPEDNPCLYDDEDSSNSAIYYRLSPTHSTNTPQTGNISDRDQTQLSFRSGKEERHRNAISDRQANVMCVRSMNELTRISREYSEQRPHDVTDEDTSSPLTDGCASSSEMLSCRPLHELTNTPDMDILAENYPVYQADFQMGDDDSFDDEPDLSPALRDAPDYFPEEYVTNENLLEDENLLLNDDVNNIAEQLDYDKQVSRKDNLVELSQDQIQPNIGNDENLITEATISTIEEERITEDTTQDKLTSDNTENELSEKTDTNETETQTFVLEETLTTSELVNTQKATSPEPEPNSVIEIHSTGKEHVLESETEHVLESEPEHSDSEQVSDLETTKPVQEKLQADGFCEENQIEQEICAETVESLLAETLEISERSPATEIENLKVFENTEKPADEQTSSNDIHYKGDIQSDQILVPSYAEEYRCEETLPNINSEIIVNEDIENKSLDNTEKDISLVPGPENKLLDVEEISLQNESISKLQENVDKMSTYAIDNVPETSTEVILEQTEINVNENLQESNELQECEKTDTLITDFSQDIQELFQDDSLNIEHVQKENRSRENISENQTHTVETVIECPVEIPVHEYQDKNKSENTETISTCDYDVWYIQAEENVAKNITITEHAERCDIELQYESEIPDSEILLQTDANIKEVVAYDSRTEIMQNIQEDKENQNDEIHVDLQHNSVPIKSTDNLDSMKCEMEYIATENTEKTVTNNENDPLEITENKLESPLPESEETKLIYPKQITNEISSSLNKDNLELVNDLPVEETTNEIPAIINNVDNLETNSTDTDDVEKIIDKIPPTDFIKDDEVTTQNTLLVTVDEISIEKNQLCDKEVNSENKNEFNSESSEETSSDNVINENQYSEETIADFNLQNETIESVSHVTDTTPPPTLENIISSVVSVQEQILKDMSDVSDKHSINIIEENVSVESPKCVQEDSAEEPCVQKEHLPETSLQKQHMQQQECLEEACMQQEYVRETCVRQEGIQEICEQEKSLEETYIQEKCGQETFIQKERTQQQECVEEAFMQQEYVQEIGEQQEFVEEANVQQEYDRETCIQEERKPGICEQQKSVEESSLQQECGRETCIQEERKQEISDKQEYVEKTNVQQECELETSIQEERKQEICEQQESVEETSLQQQCDRETYIQEERKPELSEQQKCVEETIVQQECVEEKSEQQEYDRATCIQECKQEICKQQESVEQECVEEKNLQQECVEEKSLQQECVEKISVQQEYDRETCIQEERKQAICEQRESVEETSLQQECDRETSILEERKREICEQQESVEQQCVEEIYVQQEYDRETCIQEERKQTICEQQESVEETSLQQECDRETSILEERKQEICEEHETVEETSLQQQCDRETYVQEERKPEISEQQKFVEETIVQQECDQQTYIQEEREMREQRESVEETSLQQECDRETSTLEERKQEICEQHETVEETSLQQQYDRETYVQEERKPEISEQQKCVEEIIVQQECDQQTCIQEEPEMLEQRESVEETSLQQECDRETSTLEERKQEICKQQESVEKTSLQQGCSRETCIQEERKPEISEQQESVEETNLKLERPPELLEQQKSVEEMSLQQEYNPETCILEEHKQEVYEQQESVEETSAQQEWGREICMQEKRKQEPKSDEVISVQECVEEKNRDICIQEERIQEIYEQQESVEDSNLQQECGRETCIQEELKQEIYEQQESVEENSAQSVEESSLQYSGREICIQEERKQEICEQQESVEESSLQQECGPETCIQEERKPGICEQQESLEESSLQQECGPETCIQEERKPGICEQQESVEESSLQQECGPETCIQEERKPGICEQQESVEESILQQDCARDTCIQEERKQEISDKQESVEESRLQQDCARDTCIQEERKPGICEQQESVEESNLQQDCARETSIQEISEQESIKEQCEECLRELCIPHKSVQETCNQECVLETCIEEICKQERVEETYLEKQCDQEKSVQLECVQETCIQKDRIQDICKQQEHVEETGQQQKCTQETSVQECIRETCIQDRVEEPCVEQECARQTSVRQECIQETCVQQEYVEPAENVLNPTEESHKTTKIPQETQLLQEETSTGEQVLSTNAISEQKQNDDSITKNIDNTFVTQTSIIENRIEEVEQVVGVTNKIELMKEIISVEDSNDSDSGELIIDEAVENENESTLLTPVSERLSDRLRTLDQIFEDTLIESISNTSAQVEKELMSIISAKRIAKTRPNMRVNIENISNDDKSEIEEQRLTNEPSQLINEKLNKIQKPVPVVLLPLCGVTVQDPPKKPARRPKMRIYRGTRTKRRRKKQQPIPEPIPIIEKAISKKNSIEDARTLVVLCEKLTADDISKITSKSVKQTQKATPVRRKRGRPPSKKKLQMMESNCNIEPTTEIQRLQDLTNIKTTRSKVQAQLRVENQKQENVSVKQEVVEKEVKPTATIPVKYEYSRQIHSEIDIPETKVEKILTPRVPEANISLGKMCKEEPNDGIVSDHSHLKSSVSEINPGGTFIQVKICEKVMEDFDQNLDSEYDESSNHGLIIDTDNEEMCSDVANIEEAVKQEQSVTTEQVHVENNNSAAVEKTNVDRLKQIEINLKYARLNAQTVEIEQTFEAETKEHSIVQHPTGDFKLVVVTYPTPDQFYYEDTTNLEILKPLHDHIVTKITDNLCHNKAKITVKDISKNTQRTIIEHIAALSEELFNTDIAEPFVVIPDRRRPVFAKPVHLPHIHTIETSYQFSESFQIHVEETLEMYAKVGRAKCSVNGQHKINKHVMVQQNGIPQQLPDIFIEHVEPIHEPELQLHHAAESNIVSECVLHATQISMDCSIGPQPKCLLNNISNGIPADDNFNLNVLANLAINLVHLDTGSDPSTDTQHPGEEEEICMTVSYPGPVPLSDSPAYLFTTVDDNGQDDMSIVVQKLHQGTPPPKKGSLLEHKIQALTEKASKTQRNPGASGTGAKGDNVNDLLMSLETMLHDNNGQTDSMPQPTEPAIPMVIPNTAHLHLTPDDDDFVVSQASKKAHLSEAIYTLNFHPTYVPKQKNTKIDLFPVTATVSKDIYNEIASLADEKASAKKKLDPKSGSKEQKEQQQQQPEHQLDVKNSTKSKLKSAKPKPETSLLLSKYKSSYDQANKTDSKTSNSKNSANNPSTYIRSTRPMRMVTTRKRKNSISGPADPSDASPIKKSNTEEVFDKLLEEHKRELSKNDEVNISNLEKTPPRKSSISDEEKMTPSSINSDSLFSTPDTSVTKNSKASAGYTEIACDTTVHCNPIQISGIVPIGDASSAIISQATTPNLELIDDSIETLVETVEKAPADVVEIQEEVVMKTEEVMCEASGTKSELSVHLAEEMVHKSEDPQSKKEQFVNKVNDSATNQPEETECKLDENGSKPEEIVVNDEPQTDKDETEPNSERTASAVEVVEEWFNRVDNRLEPEPYAEIATYQTIEECNFFEEVSNSSVSSHNASGESATRKGEEKVYTEHQTPDSGIAFDEDSVQKEKLNDSQTMEQYNTEPYYQTHSSLTDKYFSNLEESQDIQQEIQIEHVAADVTTPVIGQTVELKVSISLDKIKNILPVLDKKEQLPCVKESATDSNRAKKRSPDVSSACDSPINKKRKCSVSAEDSMSEVGEKEWSSEEVMSPAASHTLSVPTKGSKKEYPDCLFGITESPVAARALCINSPYPSDISLQEGEATFYVEGGIDLCNDFPDQYYESFDSLKEQESLQASYTVDDHRKEQQALQAGYCVVDSQFTLPEHMNDGELISMIIENNLAMAIDKRMVAVNMHQVQPETKPHAADEPKRSEFDDYETDNNISGIVDGICRNLDSETVEYCQVDASALVDSGSSEVQLISVDQATSEVQVVIACDSYQDMDNVLGTYLFEESVPMQTEDIQSTPAYTASPVKKVASPTRELNPFTEEVARERANDKVIADRTELETTDTVVVTAESNMPAKDVIVVPQQKLVVDTTPSSPQPSTSVAQSVVGNNVEVQGPSSMKPATSYSYLRDKGGKVIPEKNVEPKTVTVSDDMFAFLVNKDQDKQCFEIKSTNSSDKCVSRYKITGGATAHQVLQSGAMKPTRPTKVKIDLVTGNITPVIRKPRPPLQKSLPVVEKSCPVVDKPQPVVVKPVLAPVKHQPVANKSPYPVQEQTRPSVERAVRPTPERQVPTASPATSVRTRASEHAPSAPAPKSRVLERVPNASAPKPRVLERAPNASTPKARVPQLASSAPAPKPRVPEHGPSAPTPKPRVPEHCPSAPTLKPRVPVVPPPKLHKEVFSSPEVYSNGHRPKTRSLRDYSRVEPYSVSDSRSRRPKEMPRPPPEVKPPMNASGHSKSGAFAGKQPAERELGQLRSGYARYPTRPAGSSKKFPSARVVSEECVAKVAPHRTHRSEPVYHLQKMDTKYYEFKNKSGHGPTTRRSHSDEKKWLSDQKLAALVEQANNFYSRNRPS